MSETTKHTTKKRFPKLAPRHVAIGSIVLLVIAFLITLLIIRGAGQAISPTQYQVVYTQNGQIYFGKLQNTSGDYLVIEEPYTTQAPQASQQSDDAGNATAIIPLRDQVYGPTDSIAIKSDNVTFWQNLRDDSKVTQAIKQKTSQEK